MERIKRFLLDDSGTAEATSSVVLIAAVGILLGAGVALYYGGFTTFFTDANKATTNYAGRMGPAF